MSSYGLKKETKRKCVFKNQPGYSTHQKQFFQNTKIETQLTRVLLTNTIEESIQMNKNFQNINIGTCFFLKSRISGVIIFNRRQYEGVNAGVLGGENLPTENMQPSNGNKDLTVTSLNAFSAPSR